MRSRRELFACGGSALLIALFALVLVLHRTKPTKNLEATTVESGAVVVTSHSHELDGPRGTRALVGVHRIDCRAIVVGGALQSGLLE